MSNAGRSLFSDEELPANLAPWEIAAQADRLYAEVVLNRPLTTVFHYVIPDPLRALVQPGCRVEVPFGRGDQRLIGFCVGLSTTAPTGRTIKSLVALLDREPIVDAALLDLTRWIAERYLCGWGQVLESVIPAGVKSQAGTRSITCYRLVEGVADQVSTLKLTTKQRAVITVLAERAGPVAVDELAAAAQCGPGPIQTLRDRGLLVAERERRFVSELAESLTEPPPALTLNIEQQRVVDNVLQALRQGESPTFLLHGVTGSGKTEVYIRCIQEVVSYGRQAIVLVPEISLTPQTIRRFRSRFAGVAVLHSHLTDVERHAHWKQIASGAVQVVVGARSAVFAPVPHLGLIVIDEEHETSFKQDSTPRYHAREVARQRAQRQGVPLLLGSATPTLESWHRVQTRQDRLLSLPRRVAQLPLPPVVVVDVRNDPVIQQQQVLGRALQTAIHAALRQNGQVILFLNLRGFAPLLLCRACGEAVRCPACSLTLTWHKTRNCALCHTCGYETPTPERCPHCQRPGLRSLGFGTERLEQEVRRLFPKAACLRMDSDTMKARGSHDVALEQFRRGEVQILLGTQMIAKGLDFPNVTLVGVVDADTSLRQPDLRARERTFQLIAQVAGRTGRSERGGRVLVQTACPDDFAIQLAARHDYLGFAARELQERREALAPPYRSIARVILRGKEEGLLAAEAERFAELLRKHAALALVEQQKSPTATDTGASPVLASNAVAAVRVIGPAPCPIARIEHYFRYHLQLSAVSLEPLQALWRSAVPELNPASGIEFVVDVDPMNLR